MSSLQMRPGPSQMFEFMANSGADTLGMGWSKAGHIAAWQAAARAVANLSNLNSNLNPNLNPDARAVTREQFAKRAWAFDFTVLPPNARNASQLYLDTAEQQSVFDVLAGSHPMGPGAVIAKTESLHVDLGAGCNTW